MYGGLVNTNVGNNALDLKIAHSFPKNVILKYIYSWIKNNTDAGLHVVIELVEGHIYTMTLCVCVCVPIQESRSLVDSYVGCTY